MANGDAERTIRHSLLERPPGRNPRAPATPSADRPRCPIAPCRASKGLKMLKTTRASYWLELASIWDRRHVRLGSAPPRLRRRYARNDGKRPWKWEQSEPVALAKSRHWFLGVANATRRANARVCGLARARRILRTHPWPTSHTTSRPRAGKGPPRLERAPSSVKSR